MNIDNPRLDCRLKGYENFSPKRIILDKDLDIDLNTYIIKSVKKDNTIIFHNSVNNAKIKLLKKRGVILIKLKLNNKKRFDLKNVLKKIFVLGIRYLIVEGGDKITKSMLKGRLINKFYLFKSSKNLLKTKNSVTFTSKNVLMNNYKFKIKETSKLAKDKISIYIR